MPSKEEILENYKRGLSVQGSLRTQYVKHATHFLTYAEGSGGLAFDRQAVDTFLKHLAVTHHYSPGTVAFIFRIVRTMFARSDIDWPYRHGEAPMVRESDINAPALHPDVIRKMIEVTKASGEPDEKAFLAISSTYGTRKEEMARIISDDVKLQDRTIHISTVKHGRDRLHLIPDELVPIFSQYDFAQGTNGQRLFMLWYRLEHRVGLKHVEGVNWHCAPPGTPIQTSSGIKPIEEVATGDLVWGKGQRDGRYSKVMETFTHPFSGELFQVEAHGLLPIVVTGNQPLLVKKVNFRPRAKSARFRKNIQFVNADSVAPGDYLIMPKYTANSDYQVVDFSPYIGRKWTKCTHLRNGLKIDEDVAEFLGWYLADGAGSKGANQLYFGHNELDDLNRIKGIIEHKLGFKARVNKQWARNTELKGQLVTGWCWRLQFGGETLRRFLKDQVKINSHQAQVPVVIFNSPASVIRSFLIGYFDGDGYLPKGRGGLTASTVCKNLALQIQLLATGLGIWTNLTNHPSDRSRYHISMSKSDTQRLVDGKTTIRTQGSHILDSAKYFYCPIVKVTKVPYSGLVHNLETRQHTYCLNNAVSHNSVRRTIDTLLLARGVPAADVMSFLRWKQRTSSNMPYRYSAQTFVGFDGKTTNVIGEALRVDQFIFGTDDKGERRHPFIQYWG